MLLSNEFITKIDNGGVNIDKLIIFNSIFDKSIELNIGIIDNLIVYGNNICCSRQLRSIIDKVARNGKISFHNVLIDKLDCLPFNEVHLSYCTIPWLNITNDTKLLDKSKYLVDIVFNVIEYSKLVYAGYGYYDNTNRFIKHGIGIRLNKDAMKNKSIMSLLDSSNIPLERVKIIAKRENLFYCKETIDNREFNMVNVYKKGFNNTIKDSCLKFPHDAIVINKKEVLKIDTGGRDIKHLYLQHNIYSKNKKLELNIGVIYKLTIINIKNYYIEVLDQLIEHVVDNGTITLNNIVYNKFNCSRFRRLDLTKSLIFDLTNYGCNVVNNCNSEIVYRVVKTYFDNKELFDDIDYYIYSGYGIYYDEQFVPHGFGTLTQIVTNNSYKVITIYGCFSRIGEIDENINITNNMYKYPYYSPLFRLPNNKTYYGKWIDVNM